MAFIVLDIVTGVIKAIRNNNLSSSKMRDGLFNKLAFMFALVLAFAIQWACLFFGLPDSFKALYPAVSLYIIATEIISCVENLGEINSELKNNSFLSKFEAFEDIIKDQEIEGKHVDKSNK